VFLAGEHAYKVKKPVRLAFLDYSTLSLRRAACLEEVRVNRELAPGIYLGVRAILRTSEGFRFAAQDTPGAVEYAVLMRRFDETHTLLGAIQTRSLTHAQIREVARRLADFHPGSPALADGGAAQVPDAWSANIEEIQRLERAGAWRVEAMRGFGEAFVNAHATEIERRVREVAGVTRAVDERIRAVARRRSPPSRSPCFPPGRWGRLPGSPKANRRLA
jgi:hypothetical protein